MFFKLVICSSLQQFSNVRYFTPSQFIDEKKKKERFSSLRKTLFNSLTFVVEKNNSIRLQWRDIHQGTERLSDLEPETTSVQRGLLRVLQALPIEEHL